MSQTISVEQAAARLAELVGTLKPGDEIILTQQEEPVARLVPSEAPRMQRKPGTCKGMLVIRQDDDEHLGDFKEYMP